MTCPRRSLSFLCISPATPSPTPDLLHRRHPRPPLPCRASPPPRPRPLSCPSASPAPSSAAVDPGHLDPMPARLHRASAPTSLHRPRHATVPARAWGPRPSPPLRPRRHGAPARLPAPAPPASFANAPPPPSSSPAPTTPPPSSSLSTATPHPSPASRARRPRPGPRRSLPSSATPKSGLAWLQPGAPDTGLSQPDAQPPEEKRPSELNRSTN